LHTIAYNTLTKRRTEKMAEAKSMLLEVIGDTPENRTIDFLLEGKGIDYSITDIAEGCGVSRPTIYKILPKLVKEKVVLATRKIGNITLYRLDEQNEKVRALMKLEEILLKKSFDQVEGKESVPVPQ
jgi:DNA-binding transcriptional ArsR family regulator